MGATVNVFTVGRQDVVLGYCSNKHAHLYASSFEREEKSKQEKNAVIKKLTAEMRTIQR